MSIRDYRFKQYRKPKQVQETIGFTWSPDSTRFTELQVYCILDDICANSAYYSYYPEYRNIEEQTGKHYHGILRIFDKVKWFKRSKPMWEMMNPVKPHWEFDITQFWSEYCKKQSGTLYTNYNDECVCNMLPLPRSSSLES